MTITVGERLPSATLFTFNDGHPETIELSSKLSGRKVVIFGLPGAFTGTCSTAHVPSFIRTKDQLAAKGVDEIICISVNDAFVMDAWSKDTGAGEAGITMLGDPQTTFTKEIGLDFSFLAAGLSDRSKRYAMLVDDGVVSLLQVEDSPVECGISAGESLLDAM